MNKFRFVWACMWIGFAVLAYSIWLTVVFVAFGWKQFIAASNGEGVKFPKWKEES